MFGVLPERITIDQILAAGGRLQGKVTLGSLPRLADMLQANQAVDPDAEADLNLSRDPLGCYRLQGKVQARFWLRCERCQDTLVWPVESKTDLFLVGSEAAAAALGDEAEYAIVVDDAIKVHELIEDELILALPLVAKHPQGTECGDRILRGPLAESGARDNPFAILKKLKL